MNHPFQNDNICEYHTWADGKNLLLNGYLTIKARVSWSEDNIESLERLLREMENRLLEVSYDLYQYKADAFIADQKSKIPKAHLEGFRIIEDEDDGSYNDKRDIADQDCTHTIIQSHLDSPTIS